MLRSCRFLRLVQTGLTRYTSSTPPPPPSPSTSALASQLEKAKGEEMVAVIEALSPSAVSSLTKALYSEFRVERATKSTGAPLAQAVSEFNKADVDASASLTRAEFLLWWESRGRYLPMHGVGAAAAAGRDDATVPRPSRTQLIQHSMRAAIPFVGFGVVDNALMLLAGDYIDITIGQSFGISTLASAGLGNMVADVSGIASGGFIESMADRMGLKDPKLSLAQLRLRVTRYTQTGASMVGIVIGCAIGMFPLLFLETDHHHDHDHDSTTTPSSTSSTPNATPSNTLTPA